MNKIVSDKNDQKLTIIHLSFLFACFNYSNILLNEGFFDNKEPHFHIIIKLILSKIKFLYSGF
jgi:hypothetical protein